MKIGRKILLTGVVIISLVYGVTYIFITVKGAAVITAKLKDLTHKDVKVKSVRLIPFLKLEVRDLNIEGLLKADYISVSASIIGLLSGRLAFNELKIIGPELTYERRPVAEHPNLASLPSDYPPEATPHKERYFCPVFKHISITRGKIDFVDYSVGSNGIKLTIKDILLSLNNLSASHPTVSNFEIAGIIPWHNDNEEGKIRLDGWIDLFKKDMHASLKIEDIDGIYLYPYYSQWLDIKNSVIEKAKLDFTSNIQGFNNDISAECHLELNDLVFKHDADRDISSQRKEKMTNAVLDLFKSPQNKIVLDFTHKTRMDNPQFGFINIKGAVENRFASIKRYERPLVGDIFTLPVKLLEGIVVSTTDLSKAAIDGTFAVGNELKKSLAASFTREKEE